MIVRTSFAAALAASTVALTHPGVLRAQTVSVYAMDCISLSQLSSSDMVPQLVRSMRDCIGKGRYEEAVQLFFAYSVYSEFDLKRVLYDRQNDAIVDLNNWMFSDYPRPILGELRYFSNELRNRDSDVFSQTCAALLAAGPPSYLPYYLVGRGIEKEVEKPDWRVDEFNVRANWRDGLAVNGCPVG